MQQQQHEGSNPQQQQQQAANQPQQRAVLDLWNLDQELEGAHHDHQHRKQEHALFKE
jgi:hypothetical protein